MHFTNEEMELPGVLPREPDDARNDAAAVLRCPSRHILILPSCHPADSFRRLPILCDWRQGHCATRVRWGGLTKDEASVRAALVADVWSMGAIVEQRKKPERKGGIDAPPATGHAPNGIIQVSAFRPPHAAPAGHHYGRGKYMVFTNYDIILRRDFYTEVRACCARGCWAVRAP